LTFSDEEDAVGKIDAVLASDALKVILRQHLAARGRVFSAEKFASSVRAVVFEFLEQKGIISQRGLENNASRERSVPRSSGAAPCQGLY
jgi:hypothetical protein